MFLTTMSDEGRGGVRIRAAPFGLPPEIARTTES